MDQYANFPVPPSGPRTAAIAIIGEAGGSDEAKRKRPFVGRTGRSLDRFLVGAKIPRKELYLDNFVPLHPEYNEIRPWYLGKVPMTRIKQVKEAGGEVFEHWAKWDAVYPEYYGLTAKGVECREALIERLRGTEARVVMSLGAAATLALTGKAGITSLRGSPLTIDALPG